MKKIMFLSLCIMCLLCVACSTDIPEDTSSDRLINPYILSKDDDTFINEMTILQQEIIYPTEQFQNDLTSRSFIYPAFIGDENTDELNDAILTEISTLFSKYLTEDKLADVKHSFHIEYDSDFVEDYIGTPYICDEFISFPITCDLMYQGNASGATELSAVTINRVSIESLSLDDFINCEYFVDTIMKIYYKISTLGNMNIISLSEEIRVDETLMTYSADEFYEYVCVDEILSQNPNFYVTEEDIVICVPVQNWLGDFARIYIKR